MFNPKMLEILGRRRGFQEDLLVRRLRDAEETVQHPKNCNAQHRIGNSQCSWFLVVKL